MKKIILILLLNLSLTANSQSNSSEISAEGNAKMKIKPDLASFKISVHKRNEVEKTAIKELNEEIQKLQIVLTKLGFTSKNIKISDYSVSKDQYAEEKKDYDASNDLTIEFLLDNKLINAFYQELQSNNFKDVDVQFETFLSEQLEKNTRQKLVQLAIEDAKSNADNIAKSLDLKINNVKQVSKYSERLYDKYARVDMIKFDKPVMAAGAYKDLPNTSFEKFEVEEKELEEHISIVFEIAKK